MRWLRKLVPAFIIVALLFGTVVPVSYAQNNKPIPGTFHAKNKAPTVSAIHVYSDALLESEVTDLIPGVMYYIKVTAGDVNTLDDVNEITVTFFYDPIGQTPPVTLPSVYFTGDPKVSAQFTWQKNGGADLWTVSPTDSTWSIDSLKCAAPTMTDTSGDWIFAITPSKVATESVGRATWDLHASIYDLETTNGQLYARGKEMLWYGEILTAADAKADFGDVLPGSGFGDNVNEVGSIAIKYISNGAYNQSVKSSPTWAGGTYVANFDSTGAALAQQDFSLMADEAGTYANRVQVTTDGAIFDTDPQTAEAGVTVATNTLWLKLAPYFNIDTYTGTITYVISN